MKIFSKNDEEFVCKNCQKQVAKLGYSSRNHCPHCLHSLHVDINPGDRASLCGGILEPVFIELDSKKGYIINFKCKKCGALGRNKAAKDDSMAQVLNIMRNRK